MYLATNTMQDVSNSVHSKRKNNCDGVGSTFKRAACSTPKLLLSTALKLPSQEKSPNPSIKDVDNENIARPTTGHSIPAKQPKLTLESELLKCNGTSKLSSTDIDREDADNPLYAVEYVEEMYEYWRSIELPIPNYMKNQTELAARSRAILMGWVIEVQQETNFEPATLYLCAGIIDRYIGGVKNLPLDDLQLVALGALLVSTKYEERWYYSTEELTSMCDKAYSEAQVSWLNYWTFLTVDFAYTLLSCAFLYVKIIEMETDILKVLDYHLTIPSPNTFLVRFLKAACKDISSHANSFAQMAYYILDVSLLSYHMNQTYLPSELAATAIFLSRKCFCIDDVRSESVSLPIWPEILQFHTGYSQRKLETICSVFMKEKVTIKKWGIMKSIKKKHKVASFDRLLQQASFHTSNEV